jgi:hypothetical protein
MWMDATDHARPLALDALLGCTAGLGAPMLSVAGACTAAARACDGQTDVMCSDVCVAVHWMADPGTHSAQGSTSQQAGPDAADNTHSVSIAA